MRIDLDLGTSQPYEMSGFGSASRSIRMMGELKHDNLVIDEERKISCEELGSLRQKRVPFLSGFRDGN
jgi:hypothetical protein